MCSVSALFHSCSARKSWWAQWPIAVMQTHKPMRLVQLADNARSAIAGRRPRPPEITGPPRHATRESALTKLAESHCWNMDSWESGEYVVAVNSGMDARWLLLRERRKPAREGDTSEWEMQDQTPTTEGHVAWVREIVKI